ncbi:MAG TPA: DUF3592 domain-containing protein [Rubellimicrobium sp.]|nr:DUF3592 domain-containing protein [Rubellimicrobium sp.]
MIADVLKRGGLAALVCAAIALVAAAFWAGDSATARGLARDGLTTPAYVVQKHQDSDAASGEVTYAYQSVAADGTRTTHRVRHDVPASVFDALAVGAQVEVRYLPGDPAVAEVYAGEHADDRTFLDILALVAAAAAALITLMGPRMTRPARPLAPQAA